MPEGALPALRRWGFPVALAVSLLLHALVLSLQGGKLVRGQSPPRLSLTLRSPPEKVVPTEFAQAIDRRAVREVPARTIVHPVTSPVPGHAEKATRPPTDASTSLDMETIRNQARKLVGEAPSGGVRNVTAMAARSPAQSVIAKAIGRDTPVFSETVLADGSRFVRFKGNTCLRVPAHVPRWRDSGVVPVQWVVTNCAD